MFRNVGTNSENFSGINKCTLIFTRLCKPDDSQIRSKHVADVTRCRITTVNCLV